MISKVTEEMQEHSSKKMSPGQGLRISENHITNM